MTRPFRPSGVVVLLLLAACVTAPAPRPPEPTPPTVPPGPSAARQLVDRFVANAQARQFDALFPLLARSLRERYGSAARLQADFESDPSAAERLVNIARAKGEPVEQGDAASLEWAPGKRLRLVREGDGWHVAALE